MGTGRKPRAARLQPQIHELQPRSSAIGIRGRQQARPRAPPRVCPLAVALRRREVGDTVSPWDAPPDTHRSHRPANPPPTHRLRCSMLRAAALAAGLGPRLGHRLLSTAATKSVPSPNQQPEVFYNQVTPPAALFSPGDAACWVGRP